MRGIGSCLILSLFRLHANLEHCPSLLIITTPPLPLLLPPHIFSDYFHPPLVPLLLLSADLKHPPTIKIPFQLSRKLDRRHRIRTSQQQFSPSIAYILQDTPCTCSAIVHSRSSRFRSCTIPQSLCLIPKRPAETCFSFRIDYNHQTASY